MLHLLLANVTLPDFTFSSSEIYFVGSVYVESQTSNIGNIGRVRMKWAQGEAGTYAASSLPSA